MWCKQDQNSEACCAGNTVSREGEGGGVEERGEIVDCARLVLEMEGEKEYSVKMQALTSYACWKVLGV